MSEETKSLSKKERDDIFVEELLPHAEALNTFAYHLTYSETYSKDLVQETYLKAYKALEYYEPGTNSKAWLFKILKNTYINDYRKKSRRPSQVDYEEYVGYQDLDEGSSVQYSDLRSDIYDNLMGDEVTAAIDSLNEEFKTVILLADIEEFSYEEISEILDIPIGTVRSRLFRARNALKEKLKTYANNLGYEDKRGAKNEKNKND